MLPRPVAEMAASDSGRDFVVRYGPHDPVKVIKKERTHVTFCLVSLARVFASFVT